jgi:hypothetical protein
MKSLRKKNCRDRLFIRKRQFLFQRSSSSSNLRRRCHFYKFCKCCLVHESSCSRLKLLRRFSSMSIISRSFSIDTKICLNYDLEKREKVRRLSRYCDLINEQYVRVVINANVSEWKELCKTLCRDYKNKNFNQQLHSLKYFEVFKNKVRTSLKEISQYYRQYTIIFEK